MVLFSKQLNYPEQDVAGKQTSLERPPYSYMAMIQFAINSNENRKMTLKDIYNWIEDHFPYFRNVAKPGWKVMQSKEILLMWSTYNFDVFSLAVRIY